MTPQEIKEKLYELMMEVDGNVDGSNNDYKVLQQKIDLTIETVWDIISQIDEE